jgi:hypothetical protein
MINRDQNFLVGEWNLEAISGNVRGDVWWHANNARSDENAREEQGDDEINSPKNDSKRKKKKTKKKEMSVEFEIRLKDVRLVLNERDESANRGGRFFSRAIALSHFLAMKMFLRVFQFVARLCVPKKKLSQIMFYSGTYSDADFVSSEGTAFEKIIFVSPDDDDYSDSIGYVEHDVIKCSENIKTFTEKEMRSRHLKKDVRDTKLLLVRKFHLNKDKTVLTLVTPNDSTSKKPGLQLKWRKIVH